MSVDSTSVKDPGNINESKMTKGTYNNISVKESNLTEKRAYISEMSDNGHHGQSAGTIRPLDAGTSSPLLENGRSEMHAKKAKDWKDLAQRLLFSETKSISTGRQKHDHESENGQGTENSSAHKKPSDIRSKLEFREETSALSSKGSMKGSKDYILFSPTRMAAAKKRFCFKQQKPSNGNLSVSVLTPPPGLDLSSLCSSPADAGKLILLSGKLILDTIKGPEFPLTLPTILCPKLSCSQATN